jgi:hypothetical protein
MMTETSDMLARIEKLESENHKIKWACLIAVFVVLGSLIVAHTRNKGKLDVTDLIVRDASGAIIARLGADRHGTCLALTVRSGASSASLCVDNFYGSNLDLKNRTLETKASLSAGRKLYEGGDRLAPGLFINGEGGQAMLSVNVGSDTRLLLGRSEDQNSVLLSPGQEPAIRVVNARGKKIGAVPR